MWTVCDVVFESSSTIDFSFTVTVAVAFNVLVLVFVPGLDNRWVRRHTHKSIIVVVFIKLTIFIFVNSFHFYIVLIKSAYFEY